jgi:hypothetical protein
MSSIFIPTRAAKIRYINRTIDSDISGVENLDDRHYLAAALMIRYVETAFNMLSRYIELYDETGGEGWLELAYGELKLIEILSRRCS